VILHPRLNEKAADEDACKERLLSPALSSFVPQEEREQCSPTFAEEFRPAPELRIAMRFFLNRIRPGGSITHSLGENYE
jgi:hypothetical protein